MAKKRRSFKRKVVIGGVVVSGAAAAAVLAKRALARRRAKKTALTRGLNFNELATSPAISLAERLEVALLPKGKVVSRRGARIRSAGILRKPRAAARKFLGI